MDELILRAEPRTVLGKKVSELGLRVEGSPVRVLDRVAATGIGRGYALSSGGILVHQVPAAAGDVENTRLIIVDPGRGVFERLPDVQKDVGVARLAPLMQLVNSHLVFHLVHLCQSPQG